MKKALFLILLFPFLYLFPFEGNAAKADKILVEKSKRTLKLYRQGKLLKKYSISLGDSPEGPKTTQGDEKTPEGSYFIDGKNAHSCCHLSLHISYPNGSDLEQARQRGVSPGGDITIHGFPNGAGPWFQLIHLMDDWTDGCIGVRDSEIEEIYRSVGVGTPIEIRP